MTFDKLICAASCQPVAVLQVWFTGAHRGGWGHSGIPYLLLKLRHAMLNTSELTLLCPAEFYCIGTQRLLCF